MADQPDVCRLSFVLDGEEKSFVLAEGRAVIGRSPECDFLIRHESVSRQHAVLSNEGGAWLLADLESKNGIKVNTYRVSSTVLEDGDCVDIGSVRVFADIGPEGRKQEARVVFDEDDRKEAQHTEFIDLDQLEDMFGSSALPEPGPGAAPFEEGSASGPEGPNLPRLVGEAAEVLLTCDTLPQTLERILELVFDNIPAERGVICMVDPETAESRPMVMRTREGNSDQPIRISQNIANDCIANRQSVLVRDTLMDDRFGGAQSVILMQIHSAMCAPLYHDGRVDGFIYVDRHSPQDPFDTAQLQALTTLAKLSAVAVEQARLRDDVRHAEEARKRLARYSSPAVVERILAADALQGMSADEREVTVLFADLKGFTSLAEQMRSSEVVRLLNRVFERLTEAVFAFEGTLDKFRGDGMMAFFGAPLPQADHAVRAVRAALRMQQLLEGLNAEAAPEHRLAMRIGVNSGQVVVGDIGSQKRKDYTVIGDAVNVASRLESSVAQPGQVVIGPGTYERLGPTIECRELEEIYLKGKSRSVRPWLVLGEGPELLS